MSYTVIYHKNCPDGMAAALAVRQYLWDTKQMAGAKFLTAQYGDPLPDAALIDNRDVVIVDFSYPREALLDMKSRAVSLLVIDHHATAEQALAGLDFCIFDMAKSGAVLAWEFFHPGKPLPLLMSYVQDRDLWQWALPFSKQVSAGLASHPPFLDQMARYLDDGELAALVGEGAPIVRYQDNAIGRAMADAPLWDEIGGHRVPVKNATTLISEICNAMLEKYPEAPFAASYFDMPGKRVVSLRGRPDGVNVAEVAKQYGGGGHPQAAGFTIDKKGGLFESQGGKDGR